MSPTSFPFLKKYIWKKMAAVQYSFKYVAVSKNVKSGQMESYFTNMDLPEIRGDFPKPQLLEEIGCFFRSRATLTRNILVTWIWVRPASVRCARLTASGCSGPLEVYPQGFPRFQQNKKGSNVDSEFRHQIKCMRTLTWVYIILKLYRSISII